MSRRKKSYIASLLYHRATLTAIGLVVLLLISVPLARNVSREYRINNEIKELEAEIATLRSQNTELKEVMDYLESDQFIEEQARLNLSYRKPEESVVVVRPQEDEGTGGGINNYNNGGSPGNMVFKRNNTRNWWHYFFD